MDYSDGKTCPYCDKPTQYVDSEIIYGRSYGMVYYCEDCKAWCGVHKGTNLSLGRLANSELRELKKAAHAVFDPLWVKKVTVYGVKKNIARNLAYTWLSKQMKIDYEKTHIGMFNEEQCKQVIEICKPHNK